MNKIDTTKYLRQMKYLPDITPLSNILLIIIITLWTPFMTIRDFGLPLAETPEIKYAHYEPSDYSFPCVVIKKTGKVYIHSREGLENLFEIRNELADQIEELQRNPRKIMIYADGEAPWGKIIDILKIAKEAGMNVAGFMMEGEYSILGYWNMKKLYREKGLKEPTVTQ